MRTIDLSDASWRKSSYSNQDGGACVEISDDFAVIVPVRDSKVSHGPVLVFPAMRLVLLRLSGQGRPAARLTEQADGPATVRSAGPSHTREPSGQASFFTGSRIATHST